MEPQPHIAQGFIEHTVKWALMLPVQIRRAVIVPARDHAHLSRQAQRGEAHGDHFGDLRSGRRSPAASRMKGIRQPTSDGFHCSVALGGKLCGSLSDSSGRL